MPCGSLSWHVKNALEQQHLWQQLWTSLEHALLKLSIEIGSVECVKLHLLCQQYFKLCVWVQQAWGFQILECLETHMWKYEFWVSWSKTKCSTRLVLLCLICDAHCFQKKKQIQWIQNDHTTQWNWFLSVYFTESSVWYFHSHHLKMMQESWFLVAQHQKVEHVKLSWLLKQ